MTQDMFRIPTNEEKRDYTEIGPMRQKTAKEKFLEELGKKRAEADKKKIPFFKKPAMDDFNEYYRGQAQASLRKHGYVHPDEIKPIKTNWKKYSSPENITFVEITEIRDAHMSKKHPFDIMVKAFRYQYKGYGVEGVPQLSIMEDEVQAVKRARAIYDNKPYTDMSLAEKNSILYGNTAVKLPKKDLKAED